MIEIDDVFDAMIASGLRTLSNDERTDFLTFAFSTMAFKNIKKTQYLNNKVNILISESVDVMDKVDSAIECSNLFASNFVFWEFFLKPRVDELLRFFQCDLVWIINCNIQSCNSVGDNGNTGTHLTRANNTEWLKIWMMIEEDFLDSLTEHFLKKRNKSLFFIWFVI